MPVSIPRLPNAFARQRPLVPQPYWCTVTAYFSSGQPMLLWSGGASDVRLAARELVDQVGQVATRLELDVKSVPAAWLSSRAGYDRAVDDLAAGRSHAVTFTHDEVVWVVTCTANDTARTAVPAASAGARQ
ncbi:hypothetical protein [Kitasatospora sp. Root187]|uniref:hypothetical protein n=1 Tax=Kitasatospora sp. Root187 TaxID=1736486 RepID=UPI001F27C4B8|nr:hypothetical protein [Kitasatospora sp. Root187]